MSREFEEPTPEEIEVSIDALHKQMDQVGATDDNSLDGADYCNIWYLPEERYRPWNWSTSIEN